MQPETVPSGPLEMINDQQANSVSEQVPAKVGTTQQQSQLKQQLNKNNFITPQKRKLSKQMRDNLDVQSGQAEVASTEQIEVGCQAIHESQLE